MRKRNVVISLLLMLFGCTYDPPGGSIIIRNYSDSAIYISYGYSDSIPSNPELKLFEIETAEIEDEKGVKIEPIYSPSYRINAYSHGAIGVWGSPKQPRLSHKRSEPIRIFIIKESTMRLKTWKEIYQKQLYEKKYIFTEEQLDKIGWKFTYSPLK
jgi:hypothetical protein